MHWVRRYIFFHKLRHPKDMGPVEVTAFLNHLANERRVSASTQNQALAALLFVYRHLLQVELPWLDGLVRAKASKRLPTVLTQNEVQAILAKLSGTRWLMVSLMYGAGLLHSTVSARDLAFRGSARSQHRIPEFARAEARSRRRKNSATTPRRGPAERGDPFPRSVGRSGTHAKPLGSPPQDPSRRTHRSALDSHGARCLGLRERGGGFPGAGIRHAEDQLGCAFCAASHRFARQRTFCHSFTELGDAARCRPALAESVARRSADSGIPGCDPDPEGSSLEPGSRTIHRATPRSCEIDGCTTSADLMPSGFRGP